MVYFIVYYWYLVENRMLYINFYGTLILCIAGGACLHSNLDICTSIPHQQPAEESNYDAHSLK